MGQDSRAPGVPAFGNRARLLEETFSFFCHVSGLLRDDERTPCERIKRPRRLFRAPFPVAPTSRAPPSPRPRVMVFSVPGAATTFGASASPFSSSASPFGSTRNPFATAAPSPFTSTGWGAGFPSTAGRVGATPAPASPFAPAAPPAPGPAFGRAPNPAARDELLFPDPSATAPRRDPFLRPWGAASESRTPAAFPFPRGGDPSSRPRRTRSRGPPPRPSPREPTRARFGTAARAGSPPRGVARATRARRAATPRIGRAIAADRSRRRAARPG